MSDSPSITSYCSSINSEGSQLIDTTDLDPTPSIDELRALSDKKEPVNILVMGIAGSGKSTLVNGLLGKKVAQTGGGGTPVTGDTKGYRGEARGIQLNVYDSVGFGDCEGRTNKNVVSKIAKAGQFHLILVCVRMDSRITGDVRSMFSTLGRMLTEEMWNRSVVVLTFANVFINLDDIKDKSPLDKTQDLEDEIAKFKHQIRSFISGKVRSEIRDKIPFCIAGSTSCMKFPTTENWLVDLWEKCIARCSLDVREFLKEVSRLVLRGFVVAGSAVGGGAVGTVIGGVIGSIVPIVGTAIGAGIGAGVGGGLGATATGGVSAFMVILSERLKRKRYDSN
uniref:AIG1-type G domain-containing protein n=1 Tax=Amphimedon queenslandica TaxID=400682 RepID=A0A1X7UYE7_AMPQE